MLNAEKKLVEQALKVLAETQAKLKDIRPAGFFSEFSRSEAEGNIRHASELLTLLLEGE